MNVRIGSHLDTSCREIPLAVNDGGSAGWSRECVVVQDGSGWCSVFQDGSGWCMVVGNDEEAGWRGGSRAGGKDVEAAVPSNYGKIKH